MRATAISAVSCVSTRHMYFFMLTKRFDDKTKIPVINRYQTEIHFREFASHIYLFESCHRYTAMEKSWKKNMSEQLEWTAFFIFIINKQPVFIENLFWVWSGTRGFLQTNLFNFFTAVLAIKMLVTLWFSLNSKGS